jgi:hypothetical protein
MKKVCTKCKIEKNLTEYRNSVRNKNGLQSWCKKCEEESKKKWREKNREKIREYDKRYREGHIKETAMYYNRYRKNNKEKFNRYYRELYKNNKKSRKKILSRQREHYNKNIVYVKGKKYNIKSDNNSLNSHDKEIFKKIQVLRNLNKKIKEVVL